MKALMRVPAVITDAVPAILRSPYRISLRAAAWIGLYLALVVVGLALIWAGHIAALLWLYWRCHRVLIGRERRKPLDRFLWRSSASLSVAAIAATIWIGMAVWVPSICPPHYA